MSIQIRLLSLIVMLLLTTPVFAEPTSPVVHTGVSWGQMLSLIATLIAMGVGICFGMYRILRNHSKDLKDDLTNSFNHRFDAVDKRFDDFNQRFNDFNQQFSSRFDRIEAQLGQLNQNFMEHLKNHD